MAGHEGNVHHAGRACWEVTTHPSVPFGQDVVAELQMCFNKPERWNMHQIHMHLKNHFPAYSNKVLHESQISGWITSEVARHKKAAVLKAALAVRDAAPEGADANGTPTPAPPVVVAAFVAENASDASIEEAPTKRKQHPDSKSKKKATHTKAASCPKKKAAMKNNHGDSEDDSSTNDSSKDDSSSNGGDSDNKDYTVEEVINKRQCGGQWEWEV